MVLEVRKPGRERDADELAALEPYREPPPQNTYSRGSEPMPSTPSP